MGIIFRVNQYRNENDALTTKIDRAEAEINELVQINEVNPFRNPE